MAAQVDLSRVKCGGKVEEKLEEKGVVREKKKKKKRERSPCGEKLERLDKEVKRVKLHHQHQHQRHNSHAQQRGTLPQQQQPQHPPPQQQQQTNNSQPRHLGTKERPIFQTRTPSHQHHDHQGSKKALPWPPRKTPPAARTAAKSPGSSLLAPTPLFTFTPLTVAKAERKEKRTDKDAKLKAKKENAEANVKVPENNKKKKGNFGKRAGCSAACLHFLAGTVSTHTDALCSVVLHKLLSPLQFFTCNSLLRTKQNQKALLIPVRIAYDCKETQKQVQYKL